MEDSEDQLAVQRRNFLRFGKKSHPTEEGVDPSNEMFRGLNRRDYREFVRFGKRGVLPALSVPVVASRPSSQSASSGSEEVEEELPQWLTLLGPYQMNKKDLEPAMPSDNRRVEEKRRDDFLRFGKKWNSNNKLMKAKIMCQHRGINCDHLLKIDDDGNNIDRNGIPSYNDITLDDLIALDKLLNGRLGKKSNDFLRFG